MSAQSGLLDGLYAAQFRRITDDPGAGSALRTAFITVAAPAQWAFFVLGALLSVAANRLTAVPAWGCLAVALLSVVRRLAVRVVVPGRFPVGLGGRVSLVPPLWAGGLVGLGHRASFTSGQSKRRGCLEPAIGHQPVG